MTEQEIAFENWREKCGYSSNLLYDTWKSALEWVKNGQEPVSLYHCGFKNLHSIIIKKAAFVASSVVEGEEVTEGMRSAVIDLSTYAVEMSRLFAKNPLYAHPAPQPDVVELVEALNQIMIESKECEDDRSYYIARQALAKWEGKEWVDQLLS